MSTPHHTGLARDRDDNDDRDDNADRPDDARSPTSPGQTSEHDGGRSRPRALAVGAAVAAVLVSLLAATALSVPVTAADATPDTGDATLTVENATVAPNETATAAVVLGGSDAGISGFRATLAVDDGGVARLTNASYPEAFEVSTGPIPRRDGRALQLKAADLDAAVGTGDEPATIATIEVSGATAGTTAVAVEDLQLTDDEGESVSPRRDAGRLTVDGDSVADGAREREGRDGANAVGAPADDPVAAATSPVDGDTLLVVVAGVGLFVAAVVAVRRQ